MGLFFFWFFLNICFQNRWLFLPSTNSLFSPKYRTFTKSQEKFPCLNKNRHLKLSHSLFAPIYAFSLTPFTLLLFLYLPFTLLISLPSLYPYSLLTYSVLLKKIFPFGSPLPLFELWNLSFFSIPWTRENNGRGFLLNVTQLFFTLNTPLIVFNYYYFLRKGWVFHRLFNYLAVSQRFQYKVFVLKFDHNIP